MIKNNSALNLMKLQLESEFPTFAKAKKKDKYVPEDDEKKRAVEDDETWKIAINFRSYADGFFQEYIDRYEAKPFFYEDGRAGVVLPLGKAIIETAQAQESKNPPSFAYSPKEFKEDEAKARILETVVTKHVWYQKYVNLDQKFDIMNQDKMILGTMYQYVGYRRMFRVNRKFKKGTKLSEGKFDLSEELFYDDLVVENVYPQDVWLHPLATCVEESPWCFIRKRFDYATFLETYSDFDFYKNVK